MKKFTIGIISTLLLTFAFASTAGAAYDSSGDIRINLNSKLLPTFSGKTATTTFELQESVHNTLTNTTGVELDHSYIWIGVNGVNILAIDPPKPTYNFIVKK